MSTEAVSKYREQILDTLSDEPKSANEIAKELGVHQRTAQVELMRLALEKPDQVRYKKVGRTNLFWKRPARHEK